MLHLGPFRSTLLILCEVSNLRLANMVQVSDLGSEQQAKFLLYVVASCVLPT